MNDKPNIIPCVGPRCENAELIADLQKRLSDANEIIKGTTEEYAKLIQRYISALETRTKALRTARDALDSYRRTHGISVTRTLAAIDAALTN